MYGRLRSLEVKPTISPYSSLSFWEISKRDMSNDNSMTELYNECLGVFGGAWGYLGVLVTSLHWRTWYGTL